MPWTEKQKRLFHGVAHGSIKRKGLSSGKARELLSEGDMLMKHGGEKAAGPVHGRGDKQVDLNRRRKIAGGLFKKFMSRMGGGVGHAAEGAGSGHMKGNHPASRLFQGAKVARTIRGRGR